MKYEATEAEVKHHVQNYLEPLYKVTSQDGDEVEHDEDQAAGSRQLLVKELENVCSKIA